MILHLIKFIFSKQYRKQCVVSDVMCSCGKYEKCTRKIQTSWNNRWGTGRIWIDKKDQYRCGKIQEQIKQMKKSFNNYT